MIFNSKRRTTSNRIQVKKHFSQMDNTELKNCATLLRNCLRQNRLETSEHAQDKLQAHLNINALVGMIFKEQNLDYVIEYNETTRHNHTSHRVLVRHPKKQVVGNYLSNLFLVIDVDNGRIVTAYYNKVTDNHKSIDFSYYNKNLQINV